MKDKLYVVRKFVFAKSASQAMKKERRQKADECYIDDDWRKNDISTKDAIGFEIE